MLEIRQPELPTKNLPEVFPPSPPEFQPSESPYHPSRPEKEDEE